MLCCHQVVLLQSWCKSKVILFFGNKTSFGKVSFSTTRRLPRTPCGESTIQKLFELLFQSPLSYLFLFWRYSSSKLYHCQGLFWPFFELNQRDRLRDFKPINLYPSQSACDIWTLSIFQFYGYSDIISLRSSVCLSGNPIFWLRIGI